MSTSIAIYDTCSMSAVLSFPYLLCHLSCWDTLSQSMYVNGLQQQQLQLQKFFKNSKAGPHQHMTIIIFDGFSLELKSQTPLFPLFSIVTEVIEQLDRSVMAIRGATRNSTTLTHEVCVNSGNNVAGNLHQKQSYVSHKNSTRL